MALVERLWESAAYAEPWNFGPAEEDCRPVRALVERLAAEWGEGLRWEAVDEPGPHEAGLLRLDSSKARDRLGWTPAWGLDDAARSIAGFYRGLTTEREVREVVLGQIEAFEEAAPVTHGRPAASR
jgi:CDP-glucose 4,6-dehydratase